MTFTVAVSGAVAIKVMIENISKAKLKIFPGSVAISTSFGDKVT